MRRRLSLLPLWLVALSTAPLLASADPETGPWVNSLSGAADATVNYDETVRFSITSATDSELLKVTTPLADLCFDPDTAGAAGAARISVYRVIRDDTPTINASILLPTVPIDNSDCLQIVRGTYWVEVTTGPLGGELPVVTVSGRSS